MGKIISFTSPKGGTGKSTVTIYTANALALKEQKVIIYDCDPQGTIADKYEEFTGDGGTTPVEVVRVTKMGDDFINSLIAATDSYDFIFIDMPGRGDGENIKQIMRIIDYAIIPMNYGDSDILATHSFLEQVLQINKERISEDLGGMDISLFFNNINRTVRSKDVVRSFSQYVDGLDDIQLLKDNSGSPIVIHSREYYRDLDFNETPFVLKETLSTTNLINEFRKFIESFFQFIK